MISEDNTQPAKEIVDQNRQIQAIMSSASAHQADDRHHSLDAAQNLASPIGLPSLHETDGDNLAAVDTATEDGVAATNYTTLPSTHDESTTEAKFESTEKLSTTMENSAVNHSNKQSDNPDTAINTTSDGDKNLTQTQQANTSGTPLPVPDGLISAASDSSITAAVKGEVSGSTTADSNTGKHADEQTTGKDLTADIILTALNTVDFENSREHNGHDKDQDLGLVNACNYNSRVEPAVEGSTIQAVSDLADTADIAAKNFINTAGNGLGDVTQGQDTAEVISTVDDVTQEQDTDGTVENFSALDEVTQEHGTDDIVNMTSAVDGFVTQQVETDDQHGSKTSDLEQITNSNDIDRQELCKVGETAGDGQGKAEQDRSVDDRSGHVAEPDGSIDGTTEDQHNAINSKQYVPRHNETDRPTNDKEPKPTTEQEQVTKSFIDNNDVKLSPEQATDAAVLKDNATTFTREIPTDVRPILTSTSPEGQTVVSSQGQFIGTTLEPITDETFIQILPKEESSSSATGTTTTESGQSSSAFELVSFEKPITPALSEHSKILLDIVDSSPPMKEPDTTTSYQQQEEDKIKEKQQIDVDKNNGETKRNEDIQAEESKHTAEIDSETLKQEEHTKEHQESDSSSSEKSSVRSSSRSDSISVSKQSEEKSDRKESNSKGTDIEDSSIGSDEEHSISVSKKSEEKSDREESNNKGTDIEDSTTGSDEEHTDIASENDDTEDSASESNDSEESSDDGENTKEGDETVKVQKTKQKTNQSTVNKVKVKGKKKMQQAKTKKIKSKAKKPIKKKLNQETKEQKEASQGESDEQSVGHESDNESKDSNEMDIESHEKRTVDTKDTSSKSESKTHDSSEVTAQSSEQLDGLNLPKEPEQLSVKLPETALLNTASTESPSAEADGQQKSTSTPRPSERSLSSINSASSSTQNSQHIPDSSDHVVQQQPEIAEPTEITNTEHLHEADLEDKKDKMPTAHDENESPSERQSEDAIAEKIPVEEGLAPVKPSSADEPSVGAQDDEQDTDEISKLKEEEVREILQHEDIVENEQLNNVTELEKSGTANDGANNVEVLKEEFGEEIQLAKTSKENQKMEEISREQDATGAKFDTNTSDEIMNPEYTRSKRPKTATENKTGNKDTENKVDEKAVTETDNFEVSIQQDEKVVVEQKNMFQEEESAESEAEETNNSGSDEETESGNEGGSEDEASGNDSLTEEDLDIAEDDGSSSDSELSEEDIEKQELETVPEVREVSGTPKSPKSPRFDETQAQEELRVISRQCSPSGVRRERKPPRRPTPANVTTASPRRWSVLTPAVPLGDEMRYCLENVEKVEVQLEVCRQRCMPGPPPKRRSHFPYIYNGLAPYFNTDVLDCMVRQVKRGQRSQSARYIRPLVQGLVSSDTDYNLEKNVQSLPSPKEMLRDKYGNYYPLDRQLSIKRAQARLSFVKPTMPQKYTEHRFEPRTISFSSKRAQSAIAARRKDDNVQDYGSQMTAGYKEIEQVRKWAKREHKLWCELKGASEYERTMNDFYHFELYKLHEMRPKMRQNMRQTYETYLSNTSGARQALKECLANVDAQIAAEEQARKAQESARTKMQHLLSEQSMRACNSKATAVTKPISSALNGKQPQLATPSQLPVNTPTPVDQSKLPTRPHTANALSPNPPPPILKKPPPSATSSAGKLPTIALAFQQVQNSMKSPLTTGEATSVHVDGSDPGFYISVTANYASSRIVTPKPPTRHPQSAKSARHVEEGQGRSTNTTRPMSAAMLH